jgi:hypothetical protein
VRDVTVGVMGKGQQEKTTLRISKIQRCYQQYQYPSQKTNTSFESKGELAET